jgi:urea transport system ATP-binding protein
MPALIDLLHIARPGLGTPSAQAAGSKAAGLQDVNVTLPERAGCVSLIGAPGSGKTLLAQVALGWVPASEGEVRFLDRPLPKGGLGPGQIGWVPTHAPAFGMRLSALHACARAIAPTWDEGIWRVACGDLPLRCPGGDLSAADRARVALGVACSARPPLIWLDDPTRDLLAEERKEFDGVLARVIDRLDSTLIIAGRADFVAAEGHWRLDAGRLSVEGEA